MLSAELTSSKTKISPRCSTKDLIDKIYASELVDRKQFKHNRYKSQLSQYPASSYANLAAAKSGATNSNHAIQQARQFRH